MAKPTTTFDTAATSKPTWLKCENKWGWQISRCSTINRQYPPSSTLQSTQAIITIKILIPRKPEHHWASKKWRISDWRITRTSPEFCLEAWWSITLIQLSYQLWSLKEAKDRWKRLIKPDNNTSLIHQLWKLWMVQVPEPGRASAPRWWLLTHKETSTAKKRAAKHLPAYHRSSRTSPKNSILGIIAKQ